MPQMNFFIKEENVTVNKALKLHQDTKVSYICEKKIPKKLY